MEEIKIKNYAKLIAEVGANIQQGQEVNLTINVDASYFAKYIIEACYLAGAKKVNVDWEYDDGVILDTKYADKERMSHLTKYEIARQEFNVENEPVRIWIESDSPNALDGIDIKKYSEERGSIRKEIKKYRDIYDDKCQWCIAGVPSLKWARVVYPNLSDDEAVEALFETILKVSRAYDGDPIENWKEHDKNLQRHMKLLNDLNLKSLHYTSRNGTDLYVELMDDVIWEAGGEKTKGKEIYFQPNIPTEETFTSPNRLKTEGVVFSSKPLSYNGNIIDDFCIRFHEGKAVEVHATVGADLLKEMIMTDENSGYLGECALVPFHSPINDTKTLFFSTLYDENAACHLALGMAFKNLYVGEKELTPEEFVEHGFNDSVIHVDFMIGTDDLNIEGTTKDGRKVMIFKDGDWAI